MLSLFDIYWVYLQVYEKQFKIRSDAECTGYNQDGILCHKLMTISILVCCSSCSSA